MPESSVQTHRVTLTHALTHGRNPLCHKAEAATRESVTQDSNPMPVEKHVVDGIEKKTKKNEIRACARVCVKGWKQTHKTHRLTPHRLAAARRWHVSTPRDPFDQPSPDPPLRNRGQRGPTGGNSRGGARLADFPRPIGTWRARKTRLWQRERTP